LQELQEEAMHMQVTFTRQLCKLVYNFYHTALIIIIFVYWKLTNCN